MNDAPNQTQIEPSADAMDVFMRYMSTYTTYNVVGTALKLAYAIDLAPIVAERDRLKAALETIQDRACDSRVDHYMADFIYDACRAALEPKP